jgi:DnaK suppressor protein
MEKQKLEHYRKVLETRRLNLRESVARSEEDGRAAQMTDSAQDIADRAASSYQKEFLFARSNSDRQFLQMVERALSNISEGTYGECEQCGNEINERRLEAVPWARHCIACQEKQERGELEQQPQES